MALLWRKYTEFSSGNFSLNILLPLNVQKEFPKNKYTLSDRTDFDWVWFPSVSGRSRTLFYHHDRLLNSIAPISFDSSISEMFGVVTPGKINDYFVFLNDKSKINLHEAKTFIVEKYTTCNVLDSVWRQIAVKWNISGYKRVSKSLSNVL